MKAAWLEAVEKAFPQGHADRFPGYPLLGSELPGESASATAPWRLRVALVEPLDDDERKALLEDVEELRLAGQLTSEEFDLGSLELYCEKTVASPAWTLLERKASAVGPWGGERSVWTRDGQSVVEQTVVLDSMALKNLALLRATIARHPDIDRWVVVSSVSAGQETEALIADTLAYLTGALGGATVLEVCQQPGERFDTVWARLNICRLLRWEADLGDPGDALAGAGFFTQLSDNLS